ncbi:TNXB [Symbiodinium sp. KB8]|nr:TNXB [Symbiodinium sp. KB8]
MLPRSCHRSWLVVALFALARAERRTVPSQLRVGTFLSALRPHPLTGEDFRPTATREFVDLMKHSTPFVDGLENGIVGDNTSWVHYNWPEGFEVEFRRDGYPHALPNFTMFGSLRQSSVKATIGLGGAFVEDGEYVATWQGIGNISWEGDAEFLRMEDANTARVLVRPKSGVIVRVFQTEEADPLHGISLTPVEYQHNATEQLFHPRFLQMLNGTTALRFASWQMIAAGSAAGGGAAGGGDAPAVQLGTATENTCWARRNYLQTVLGILNGIAGQRRKVETLSQLAVRRDQEFAGTDRVVGALKTLDVEEEPLTKGKGSFLAVSNTFVGWAGEGGVEKGGERAHNDELEYPILGKEIRDQEPDYTIPRENGFLEHGVGNVVTAAVIEHNTVEYKELGVSEAMIRMRSGHRAVDIASWKGKAYPMPPHLRKEDGLTEGASSPVVVQPRAQVETACDAPVESTRELSEGQTIIGSRSDLENPCIPEKLLSDQLAHTPGRQSVDDDPTQRDDAERAFTQDEILKKLRTRFVFGKRLRGCWDDKHFEQSDAADFHGLPSPSVADMIVTLNKMIGHLPSTPKQGIRLRRFHPEKMCFIGMSDAGGVDGKSVGDGADGMIEDPFRGRGWSWPAIGRRRMMSGMGPSAVPRHGLRRCPAFMCLLRSEGALAGRQPQCGITDAKSLYDALIKCHPASRQDRRNLRNALDLASFINAMSRGGGLVRWTSQQRKAADMFARADITKENSALLSAKILHTILVLNVDPADLDAWNHDGSLTRSWENRTLPTDQTQAGPFGVCVEHMVELANRLGARPWFSMPKAVETEPDSIDSYAREFALLVNRSLNDQLKVYVEYRSCCLNGLAPGWNSQENAVQSLTLWKSWEQAGFDPERVINVISSLQQLDKFGTDVTSVEAAAIEASFSDICKYGETPCTDFNSMEASSAYGALTPAELIDAVIRPAMLKEEAEINRRVQQALHYGFEIIAFNALPLISARGYGHRGNLNWALRCESCLMKTLGRRYGSGEQAQLADGGWVFEADFVAYKGYQGLLEEDRAHDSNGAYWLHGSPEQAKAHCLNMSNSGICDGFIYIRSGEWSCGVGNDYRYGDCSTPGTAYFFKRNRLGEGSRVPPTECSAFTAHDDPYDRCSSPSRIDSYFKVDAQLPGGFADAAAADLGARDECQTSCDHAYESEHWDPPAAGLTLDELRALLPGIIAAAAAEQSLENNMIAAFREPAMEDLMLEYLERLRQIGFSTVVGGQMVREARSCWSGGKACGQASVMLHWDDDSPIRRAFSGYVQGRRAALPIPADAPTPCPQKCIHGICEQGSCKCWKGASGADCSRLAPLACHRGRKLGLSLSGVSYWTREWQFVDVFKNVGQWQAQEFTSYTWNTGSNLSFRADGYPARLLINQVAQLLTVRDVEKHYTDGWYTVLYDGEGILEFNMDVTSVHRVSRNRIRIYVNLTTSMNNGIGIRVSDTREDDPVRNIRVITPGFEEIYDTSPFHPAFLASLEGFSVLRFMDWMHANSDKTPFEWVERVTPNYYTQGSDPGVSLEYMVRLSNEVGAEPWFSLPVNATDNYIEHFMSFISEHLRPDLAVYIELGNEAWHPGFFGGQWAQQQGAAEGLSRLCWYAKRSGEMARIAKAVINGTGRELTVVAGSQSSNYDATAQLLQCEGINETDAIGLGPYFNGYNILPDPDADLDLVLETYENEVSTSLQRVREHKAVLRGTHFKLLAYEAGPAGEGDGSADDLAIQAHRNSKMKDILAKYLQALDQEFDLMVYFASCGRPSRYGSWGMIEAMDQPREAAVKYQAVQNFLANRTQPLPSSCQYEEPDCAGADGCSGKGLCGADDVCYCYRGYSGTSCLDASFTDYSSCGYRCTFDQGLCEVSEIIGNARSWHCNCREEYSGGKCSKFQCSNGCNQRGHCIASGVCSCFRGFRGSECEIDCGCGHHGQCDANNECICDQGWRKSTTAGCEWDCATADTLGCSGPGNSACASCSYGTCVDGTCRCWAGAHGPSCADLDSSLLAHGGAAFGINVATTPSTFVDVMKTSRGWTSIWDRDTQPGQFSYQGGSLMWTSRQYEWGNGLKISQNSEGYVTSLLEDQAVITLALRDVCLHAPKGRYVITYDGDGELDLGMDATPAAFQKGRIDVDFEPTCRRECWFDKAGWLAYCTDNGIAITVRRVNPQNPLRNIRIIMPGFFATHEQEPFHPWFLKNLERFSTIRLMDWAHINSESFIKRAPFTARYVRFTSTATHGGSLPRISELLLKGPDGELLSCTSEYPQLCDGDPNTDWAPLPEDGGNDGELSGVIELPEGSSFSTYMWMTSGWSRRVDPVMWRLEVSDDGHWSICRRILGILSGGQMTCGNGSRAIHRSRTKAARKAGRKAPRISLHLLQSHHSQPFYRELRMGGKRGWQRGGGGQHTSSWSSNSSWALWKGTWSPRNYRSTETRYDQVELEQTATGSTEIADAGSGKTAFLSAVQKAVTAARKQDVRLRKINEEKAARQKLWQQYVENTKRKFAKQKQEYEMDIQRLEADRVAALEAGQMAAAQVKAIVVGQQRPETRQPPLEAEEAWASLWNSVEAAPSGATFLDEAIAAAAASGMDIEPTTWADNEWTGPPQMEAAIPAPAMAAAPPGLPPPSYTALSPGAASARTAPHPPTPATMKHPDVMTGEGARDAVRHPGQRDRSLRRAPAHEEAPRPNIKDAVKHQPTRFVPGMDMQDRLDQKRAAVSGVAMRPFRTPEGPLPSDAPPAATEEGYGGHPTPPPGHIPILEDDEDSADNPFHELLKANSHPKILCPLEVLTGAYAMTRPERFDDPTGVIAGQGTDGFVAVICDLTRTGGHYFATTLPQTLALPVLLEFLQPLAKEDDRPLQVLIGTQTEPWPSGAQLSLCNGDVITAIFDTNASAGQTSIESLFEPNSQWALLKHFFSIAEHEGTCVLHAGRRYVFQPHFHYDMNIVQYICQRLRLRPEETVMCTFQIHNLDVHGNLCRKIVAVHDVPSPLATGVLRDQARDLFALLDFRPLGMRPHAVCVSQARLHVPTIAADYGLLLPKALAIHVAGGRHKDEHVQFSAHTTLLFYAGPVVAESSSTYSEQAEDSEHDILSLHDPEPMQVELSAARPASWELPWDRDDGRDEEQLLAQAQWLHDITVPAGHSWNYDGPAESADGSLALPCLGAAAPSQIPLLSGQHGQVDNLPDRASASVPMSAPPPNAPEPETTGFAAHDGGTGLGASASESKGDVASAAASPLLAIVYAPDMLRELVTVEPCLPIAPPRLLNLVQQARALHRFEAFPFLSPATPQPVLESVILVATPAWITDLAIVLFDCSRLGQGVFAARVSLCLNRESLLIAAGMPPDVPVRLYVHGLLQPLMRGQRITLRTGMTISVVPENEGAPAGYDLDVRLLTSEGWSLDAELPGPRNYFGSLFRVLTDAWPVNFLIKPGRRAHFREDVAQELGASLHRLTIKAPSSRIVDLCSYGFWTSSLLVATEQLCRIPCPPAKQRESRIILILDLRRILQGVQWRLIEQGGVRLQDVADMFRFTCPFGHHVQVRSPDSDVLSDTAAFIHEHGQVLEVSFLPDAGLRPPPSPHAPEEDEGRAPPRQDRQDEPDLPDTGGYHSPPACQAAAGAPHDALSSRSRSPRSRSGPSLHCPTDDAPQTAPNPDMPVLTGAAADAPQSRVDLPTSASTNPADTQHIRGTVGTEASPPLAFGCAVSHDVTADVRSQQQRHALGEPASFQPESLRLLHDPDPAHPEADARLQEARNAARMLGVEWPHAPYRWPAGADAEVDAAHTEEGLDDMLLVDATFAILTPGYTFERVDLTMLMPQNVADAVDLIQTCRHQYRRDLFPELVEVRPQPNLGWGIFIALPTWLQQSTLVCFDLTSLDGRIFADRVPQFVDLHNLLIPADLPDDAEVDVHAGYRSIPSMIGLILRWTWIWFTEGQILVAAFEPDPEQGAADVAMVAQLHAEEVTADRTAVPIQVCLREHVPPPTFNLDRECVTLPHQKSLIARLLQPWPATWLLPMHWDIDGLPESTRTAFRQLIPWHQMLSPDRASELSFSLYTDGSASIPKHQSGYSVVMLAHTPHASSLFGILGGSIAGDPRSPWQAEGPLALHAENAALAVAILWATQLRGVLSTVACAIRFDCMAAGWAAEGSWQPTGPTSVVVHHLNMFAQAVPGISLTYKHVHGHSDDPWNDLADFVAKTASNQLHSWPSPPSDLCQEVQRQDLSWLAPEQDARVHHALPCLDGALVWAPPTTSLKPLLPEYLLRTSKGESSKGSAAGTCLSACFATINVQSLCNKCKYIEEQLHARNVNVACLQETKLPAGTLASQYYIRLHTPSLSHWGVAVWMHRRLGICSLGDAPLLADDNDVAVLHEELVVRLNLVNQMRIDYILMGGQALIDKARSEVDDTFDNGSLDTIVTGSLRLRGEKDLDKITSRRNSMPTSRCLYRKLEPPIPDHVWGIRDQKVGFKRRVRFRAKLWADVLCRAFLQWKEEQDYSVLVLLGKQSLLYELAAAAVKFSTARIRRDILRAKQAFLQQVAGEGHHGAAKVLQRVKRAGVGGSKARPISRPLPMLLHPETGTAVTTRKQRDQVWMLHFGQQEQGHTMPVVDFLEAAQWSCYDGDVSWDISYLPSYLDIEQVLREIPRNKAAGLDNIPGEVLKAAPSAAAKALFPLFIKSMLQQHQPVQWRGGMLYEAFKRSGLQSSVDNYRSLFVSSYVAKAYHRVVRNKTQQHSRDELHPLHFGSKKRAPVTFAALFVLSHFRRCHDRRRSAAVLYLDTSAAYYRIVRELAVGDIRADDTVLRLFHRFGLDGDDVQDLLETVRHGGMLAQAGAPDALRQVVKDLHLHTWFVSRFSDGTEICNSFAGSRPGESWADLIYAYIYGRVLHKVHEHARAEGLTFSVVHDPAAGVFPQRERGVSIPVTDATWADDFAFPLEHESPQMLLSHTRRLCTLVISFCEGHGMAPNLKPGKTSVMLHISGRGSHRARQAYFRDGAKSLSLPDLGVSVVVADSYKHLGGVIDSKLTMRPEARFRLAQASSSYDAAKTLLLGNPRLDLITRARLFESVVTPTFFNIGLWLPAGKAWEALRSGYSKLVRRLLVPTVGAHQAFHLPLPVAHWCTGCWHIELVARRARLSLLLSLVQVGPPLLWAMLQEEGQWCRVLRDDLSWFVQPDPEQWPALHASAWDHWLTTLNVVLTRACCANGIATGEINQLQADDPHDPWEPAEAQKLLSALEQDRTLPSHRSQVTGPVALEYQALLVNTLGASPWVTVHHLASDDYVRQEATFWLTNLRPDVQVYVEHSNEVWNPLFPQGRYATEQGVALGLLDSTCRTSELHCARVRYNAYRSKQIFDIWADVWASQRNRVKFVLSTQAVWADVTRDLFSQNNAAGADLLGITGYMSPTGGIDQSYSARTPAEVIRLFTEGKENARSYLRAQKALAEEAGLGLAFYEGGVGLVEDGTIETGQAIGSITELLMATGRSPDFQEAVEAWLDMFREEVGDSSFFMYFVDTGFWSKYGQWGNREYYDAATATSPAAAAVHSFLDRLAGSRPACVAANSAGRGLPPDSFLGPPAVWQPQQGAMLVRGKRYTVTWGDAERLPAGLVLDFHLWQRSSCPGEASKEPVHLGSENALVGTFSWQVPTALEVGEEYFVELRPRAPAAVPSNYSALFSVIAEADAPATYLLYVENDVDLLSAFHRDCKKGDWAVAPSFRIQSCVFSSAEGCRQYRTSRQHTGPPPYLHGSFLPVKDCTLHVVGLRQTLRLEGLTRGFDLSSEDSLARAVANASLLPAGAISISVVGGESGRRLAETTGAIMLEVGMSSDDASVGSAAVGLSTLGGNSPFLSELAAALGEDSISVGVVGNLSAVDGSSEELAAQFVAQTTSTTAGITSSAADRNASTSEDPTGETTSLESGTSSIASATLLARLPVTILAISLAGAFQSSRAI